MNSRSTADTLNKLTEEEIGLIKMDYDLKQTIDNLTIDSYDEVDRAINYIKEWFLQDEIRYTNQIISLLEAK